MAMKKTARTLGVLLSTAALVVTPTLPFRPTEPGFTVQAATISSLESQLKKKQQEAAAKEAAAKKQAELKAKAEAKIKEVSGQITELQADIQQTQSHIASTGTEIEQRNQEVAFLESELRRVQDQQDVLLRQMYIMRSSMPDSLVLFADEPVSSREKEQAQFSALKKSVATLYLRITAAKLAVEDTRNQLMRKSDELKSLKEQQDEQKKGLASYQQTQAALRANADAAMKKLEADALKARQEAARLEAQISAALSAAIRNSLKGVYGSGPGVGQRVRRGDYVGVQGSTGFSTGDHVHFEVRVNDVPVNPRPYINNGTLSWPLSNFIVTQEYGRTSFSYVYAGGIHTGIDIAGPAGSIVRAPADGTVILNGCPGSCNSGYGRAWAMVLDNGLVVLAAHLRM